MELGVVWLIWSGLAVNRFLIRSRSAT